MRTAFAQTIAELGARDPRVLLLTGDLGFMALEPFSDRFPERFFNVGVAEQNMVGLATGLAEAGFRPYAYSIVTFATLRPYEFIRNGPVHHQLPVRIVGMGGGFEYGPAGPSHHGLEDVAVMRALPGMTVVAPADPAQTRTVMEATADLPGPVYLRLGKDDRTFVPGLDGRFELGRAQVVREGTDVLLLAMGGIGATVAAAGDLLAAEGIPATVAIVASVQPAPVADIAQLVGHHAVALTVEAHSVVGGLGSLVSEVVAERGLAARVVRCGVAAPVATTGSQRWLERQHGLDAPSLAERAKAALRQGVS